MDCAFSKTRFGSIAARAAMTCGRGLCASGGALRPHRAPAAGAPHRLSGRRSLGVRAGDRRRPVVAACGRTDRDQFRLALARVGDRAEYRAGAIGSSSAAPRSSATIPAAPPSASATCRCATPTVSWSRARPRPRSRCPDRACCADRLRAHRVSLVGAELSVRIEEDGQVTISTGAEKRPLAVTPAIVRAAPARSHRLQRARLPTATEPTGAERFVALVAWLDRISTLGLDGQGLGEIGLKNGILKVDDLRTDKHWTFEHINFSVNRPGGGISVQFELRGREAAVVDRGIGAPERCAAQARPHRPEAGLHQGPVPRDADRQRAIPGRRPADRDRSVPRSDRIRCRGWSRARSSRKRA